MLGRLMRPFLFTPDVFVCHVPDQAREHVLRACLIAWSKLGVKPIVLTPSGSSREFQRDRRLQAEARGGKFYILADDDCVPIQSDFVSRGFRVLHRHKQYAMLAPLPQNETIIEWTPEPDTCIYCSNREPKPSKRQPRQCSACKHWFRNPGYYTANDNEVMEHVSIGGIRFCRRVSLKEWPLMDRAHNGYDGIHAVALRDQGYRVGFIRSLRFFHLGAGTSTVWV